MEQRATVRLITNAVANFNKIAAAKRTLAVAEGRLQLLLERWESCRQLDVKITIAATAAKRTDDAYFTEAEFDLAEEAFEEAHDHFREAIAKLQPQASAPGHASLLGHSSLNDGQPSSSSTIKLPAIELPKFDGRYTEWTNYKSMFETMIIKHENLNDVQRLHYLKSTLSGEAASLVQHFSVTEENFETAWETLTETYEDKRAIIDAHLQTFLSLPVMTAERAKDLKELRDKTREALKALHNLGCPTDSWSHLIVYLTVQKLDSGSAREWEMLLGAKSEYPDFKLSPSSSRHEFALSRSFREAKNRLLVRIQKRRPRSMRRTFDHTRQRPELPPVSCAMLNTPCINASNLNLRAPPDVKKSPERRTAASIACVKDIGRTRAQVNSPVRCARRSITRYCILKRTTQQPARFQPRHLDAPIQTPEAIPLRLQQMRRAFPHITPKTRRRTNNLRF